MTDEVSYIAAFATACEQMNDFARAMRNALIYKEVKTGADIRYYESGWRLEKWIQADLKGQECLGACWWLDVGQENGRWLIESSVSVDPDGYFHSFEDKLAANPIEFRQQLESVLKNLIHAIDQDEEFRTAVGNANNP